MIKTPKPLNGLTIGNIELVEDRARAQVLAWGTEPAVDVPAALLGAQVLSLIHI